jgi:hypothetical protein
MSKKLLAALENDLASAVVDGGGEGDTVSELESEPLLETSENVESGVLDVVAADDKIVDLTDSMDVGDNAVDALEAMIIRLEEAQEEGGIDAAAAALMQVGVDAVMKSVGAEPEEVQAEMPATEAYGSMSGRQAATARAIESLGEQVKKVQAGLAAAWEKFVQWCKNLWAYVRSSNERMRVRAEKLKAAATAMTGDGESTSVENAVFGALAVNGKVDTAPVMTAAKVVKLLDEALDASNNTVQFVKSGIELMKHADSEGTALDLGVLQNVKAMSSAKAEGENHVVAGLPGNYKLVQVIPATVNMETLGKFSTSMEAGAKLDKPTGQVLKKGEMLELIKEVLAGLDTAKNASAAEKNLDVLSKEYSAALAGLNKADGNKEGVKQAKKVAVAVRKVMAQPAVAFQAYSVNVFKHYLDLVSVSLAAQKKSA